MSELNIGGELLREMIMAGAALLESKKASIDSLNVFPVPDGDTGTNMSMTMQSAVKEVKACKGTDVGEIASAVAMGALKGARGNSGVILSQIFRGFAKALSGAEEMDGAMLANALKMGTEAAYKAVMKPKEGTMLTVARMISERLEESPKSNVYQMVDEMLETGDKALRLTPSLLPVLKEAGVVDSGGMGLLTIFKGFKMALDGEEIEDYAEDDLLLTPLQSAGEGDAEVEDINDIKFGYCTEFFVIHLEPTFSEAELDKFRDKLIKLGDSVVVAHDTGFVKVHVHSNAPGKIIQLALRLGEVDKLKIENMREQNREIQANIKKNEKEQAMVAVSAGEGIDQLFTELGVSVLISGGQTMNPSIDTIEKAIKKANARTVFVLPNNSNIVMAAQQAAELSERKVVVLPTKTMMQGVSAAMAYNDAQEEEDNIAAMQRAIKNVISGSVTYAVRDTSVNGNEIHKDDEIGLIDGQIVTVGKTVSDTAFELVKLMIERQPDETVVSLFFGEEVEQKEAEALTERLEKAYPDASFACQSGGQPLYYYYISAE